MRGWLQAEHDSRGTAGLTDSFPSDWVSKDSNHFIFALNFGIATLVIACPCAVGLATPTAVMVRLRAWAGPGPRAKGQFFLKVRGGSELPL